MDTESIIRQLEAERDRLNHAIKSLRGTQGQDRSLGSNRRKRRLSAAARKRISEAQKRRWAARKKVA